jgi:hypothetical protein
MRAQTAWLLLALPACIGVSDAADSGARTYANAACSDRNASAESCLLDDGPPPRRPPISAANRGPAEGAEADRLRPLRRRPAARLASVQVPAVVESAEAGAKRLPYGSARWQRGQSPRVSFMCRTTPADVPQCQSHLTYSQPAISFSSRSSGERSTPCAGPKSAVDPFVVAVSVATRSASPAKRRLTVTPTTSMP